MNRNSIEYRLNIILIYQLLYLLRLLDIDMKNIVKIFYIVFQYIIRIVANNNILKYKNKRFIITPRL